MRALGDSQACGRACGNLGNTCYLLGDFERAIKYHKERLEIAEAYRDTAAQRRAHSNLGNSHVFLGNFQQAAEHYRETLRLAHLLSDSAIEAQACYSLGNTYTLLRDYKQAEHYHSRHLYHASKLGDKVGEGRACWSLGNAHAALGNHDKALLYASKHFEISTELGDSLGVATAQLNISDLRKVLNLKPDEQMSSEGLYKTDNPNVPPISPFKHLRVKRQSMEQLSLIKITPTKNPMESQAMNNNSITKSEIEEKDDDFLDMISRFQGERMNDQRATLSFDKENTCAPTPPKGKKGSSSEEMLNLIEHLQNERIDSQRATLAPKNKTPSMKEAGKVMSLPGLKSEQTSSNKTDDDFLDMLARVQGSRLEDQRSELPRPTPSNHNNNHLTNDNNRPARAVTLPDDDFFSLVMRTQSRRMNDQRASVPLEENDTNKN